MDCTSQQSFCLQEVVLHAASYHPKRDLGLKEFNPGVGLHFKVSDNWFAAVGGYRNSLDRTSLYAGAGRDFHLAGPLALRLTAGVVTGYEIKYAPVVLPELVVRWRDVGLAVGYLPRIDVGDKVVEAVFTFSILKRF